MSYEPRPQPAPARTRKICVVMPAYNAEKTLERTYNDPARFGKVVLSYA